MEHLNTCDNCGEPATTRCGSCGVIYYCARTCQKAKWPKHKRICNRLNTESGRASIAQEFYDFYKNTDVYEAYLLSAEKAAGLSIEIPADSMIPVDVQLINSGEVSETKKIVIKLSEFDELHTFNNL